MDQKRSRWIRLIVWFKSYKIGPNWIKSDQLGLNWFKSVQIGSNQIKLDQIGSHWFKPVQIGSKLIMMNQIEDIWFKSDKIGSILNSITECFDSKRAQATLHRAPAHCMCTLVPLSFASAGVENFQSAANRSLPKNF